MSYMSSDICIVFASQRSHKSKHTLNSGKIFKSSFNTLYLRFILPETFFLRSIKGQRNDKIIKNLKDNISLHLKKRVV